jgi:hypothetical protein
MSALAFKMIAAGASLAGEAAPADSAQFLRVAKLKGRNRVAKAAMHNKREGSEHWRGAEFIDRSRSHLNYALAGPLGASEVNELHRQLISAAQIKVIRQDAVKAIEAVVSLHPGVAINLRRYFTRTLSFLAELFGGTQNIISADVHLDECAPHMHVLIVPLLGGRLRGSAAIGGPSKLRQMLDRFHAEVGVEFGLLRYSTKTVRRSTQARVLGSTHGAVQDRSLCSVGGGVQSVRSSAGRAAASARGAQ